MDSLFRWIESSALSVWTRESASLIAYPAILSAHAIGMALAAGINAAIALRLLGAASEIPAAELRRYAGVAWIGFVINAVSGMLLLIAYPTKALTNPKAARTVDERGADVDRHRAAGQLGRRHRRGERLEHREAPAESLNVTFRAA